MRVLSTVIAVGLAAGLSTAALANDGWYVGGETGLNIVPKAKVTSSGNDYKSKQDLGYGVLGQAGYGFGPLRVEGELGWRQNGVDKLTGDPLTTVDGKGNWNLGSVMANVYYDIKTGTAFTPYIGLGLGAADVGASKVTDPNGNVLLKDNSIQLGYQGILGGSYALSDSLALKADYRYFRATEGSFKDEGAIAAFNGTDKAKSTYAAHSILVGFTYSFGAPAKPMPPMAAAPVAAAPMTPMSPRTMTQAPIAKSYLVFFDFDKSNITPEAQRIIEQAAANAKSNKSTSIALTGHTDAAGSDKYNMALSLRRANAVKAALVKLGIPEREISVVAKGKSDPLVPTKDGVREPQNRRVQIVLP
jgi:outer membrane protein OmpA-like peptidoglycan-associated protein